MRVGKDKLWTENEWQRWTVEWWKWFLSKSEDQNPAKDMDGLRHMNQDGHKDKVFFLAGSLEKLPNPPERNCNISANARVLCPLINCIYTQAEAKKDGRGSKLDARELFKHVETDMHGVTNIQLTVDGMNVLELRRVKTPKFYVNLLNDNIWGAEPGRTLAASDGIWVLLNPVHNSEKHTFEFQGQNQANFANNVKYNLHIK